MKKISKILMVALIGLSAMAMCVSCAPQSKDGSSVPGTPTGGDGRSTQKSLSDIQLEDGVYNVVVSEQYYMEDVSATCYAEYKTVLSVSGTNGEVQPNTLTIKYKFKTEVAYIDFVNSNGCKYDSSYTLDKNRKSVTWTMDLRKDPTNYPGYKGTYSGALKEILQDVVNNDNTFVDGTTITKNDSNPIYVIKSKYTDSSQDEVTATAEFSKR